MDIKPLSGKGLDSVRLADARINLWEGSVRSSKTVSSLIRWLKFVREALPGNLLMTGKTERTLKRNIIDPLTEWLGKSRCRLVEGSGELWLLGRRVYIAGANDERAQEKIRGLTLVGAYVDEVSTVPESYWSMLLTRLSVDGAKLFGTSNPDSPAHWLMRDYLDRSSMWLDHSGHVLRHEGDDRLDLARFSFRLADNPHLSAAYIKALSAEFTGLWRRRFIEGLWVAAEGAIFDMWDPDRMVADIMPPIVNWIGAGIDYGTTNPFHAVLLGLGADSCLYVVSEWRYDSRRSRRQLTDTEYSQRLRAWLEQVRVPASKRQDGTWLLGVRPHYIVVDPSAASFRAQLHQDGLSTVAANNEVLDGIRTVSSLMTAGKLKVSRDCPELLAEIPSYSWDGKAAKLGEDKPVKVNDHGCFVAGTPVLSASGWQPVERIRSGELVMTRHGLKPVTAAGMTNPAAPTVRVDLADGRTLEGTGNHPVWVHGRGFVRMDALRYGDILMSCQTPRLSVIRESSTDATRTPASGPNARTTSLVSATARSTGSAAFMRKSGRMRTARFPRAATSTTRTRTRSTTTRLTSSASPTPSTASTTRRAGPSKGAPPDISRTWKRSGPSPSPGIAAKKAGRGIASTARKPWRLANSSHSPVSNAGSLTRRSTVVMARGSAQTPANRRGGEPPAWTTSSGRATSAETRSARASTARPPIAGVRVVAVAAGQAAVPVFNLSVAADCPEYFAAGVLVHNCDAMRYDIFTTRSVWQGTVRLVA